MQRCLKVLAALLLIVMVFSQTGCKKSDDPNNGSGDNGTTPTTEGVYLGIIGFNENLFQKPIGLLDGQTKESYKSFIDDLTVENGTGLYYADYTALKKLQAYAEPPQLKDVALVTFTDGLDNVSTSSSEMDPEGYGSISAYRTALHDKITNDLVHGYNITAYTIGLRGQDISDEQEFRTNLNMLASSPNNVFEVANMNQALERFSDIANALYSVTVTSKLRIEVPGGYDEGQIIRLTFDDVSDGGNSIKYIQGTYKRTNNSRLLEDISYIGLTDGASSLASVSQSGAYYWFEFENLAHMNGNPISQTDINKLQLWKKQNSGWQRDAEFEPGTSTEVTEDKSSALIMLVLDCTTSLGDDFDKMKTGAKRFIETLSSTNTGNDNNSTIYVPEVSTTNVSDVQFSSAKCGGNVSNDGGANVTARGVCWSTNQSPTINDSHVSSGSGTGIFTCNITGLAQSQTYYVRAYATNSTGTGYGEQKTFTTTSVDLPTVTTDLVTKLSDTSIKCGGKVTSVGGANVTARGVCWSLNQNPTINDAHTTDGNGTGTFTSTINGVTFGKTYYVRAYATNAAGTSYGSQRTFNTASHYGSVGITVIKNNDYNQPAVGAVVKFENVNSELQQLNPIPTITIGETGYYHYPTFWNGEYNITITLTGYEPIYWHAIVEDGDYEFRFTF